MDADPVETARQWRDELAVKDSVRDVSMSLLLHALLEIIDGYQAQEMAETEVSAYPRQSHYTIEMLQPFGGWEQASSSRPDLPAAVDRREQLRRRWEGCRFRIIRWDKTSTVVDTDPEGMEGDCQA